MDRFSRIGLGLICALLQAQACGQGFVDVTAQSGRSDPGSYGWVNIDRGAAFLDFDGDGAQDVVVAPLPGQAFRAWRNDGDVDLYVTQTWAPNLLFLNDGTGVFTESGAAAGVDDPDNGFAATFAGLRDRSRPSRACRRVRSWR